MIEKVGIVGAGNVAWHMAYHFLQVGIEVNVFSRRPKGFRLSHKDIVHRNWESFIELNPNLLLLAVSDDEIQSASQRIPQSFKGIVAHTSGAKDIRVLSNHSKTGVFYPLQTLTKERKLTSVQIPICLEADNDQVLEQLKLLAEKVGFPSSNIKSSQRAKLHLAAVFTNNFSNKLWQMAQNYAMQQGIEASMLNPLLEETLAKFKELGGKEAQTGPAKRGDSKTIAEHIAQLEKENLSDYISVYTSLTQAIKHDSDE